MSWVIAAPEYVAAAAGDLAGIASSISAANSAAAFPTSAPWLRVHKYWPPVARVDNAYGDRNLVCACPSLETYS